MKKKNFTFIERSIFFFNEAFKTKDKNRRNFCLNYSKQLEDFADAISEDDNGEPAYSPDIPGIALNDNEYKNHYKKCIEKRFILRQAHRNGDLKVKNGKCEVKNLKFYIDGFKKFVKRAGLNGWKDDY